MKAKIRLDTMKEINQFVAICSAVHVPVHVTDGAGLKVSAKSVLGVMYSMEFEDIWCECEEDIYNKIEQFIIVE
jgi:hypothetical protein